MQFLLHNIIVKQDITGELQGLLELKFLTSRLLWWWDEGTRWTQCQQGLKISGEFQVSLFGAGLWFVGVKGNKIKSQTN